MCSVGGPFGDEEIVWPKNYRCNRCGKKFKGIGENVMCPSCQLENLKQLQIKLKQTSCALPQQVVR